RKRRTECAGRRAGMFLRQLAGFEVQLAEREGFRVHGNRRGQRERVPGDIVRFGEIRERQIAERGNDYRDAQGGSFLQFHLFSSSYSNNASMRCPNNFPILNASGRLGSYLPVSIALTVCRDTSSFSASSPCDQACFSR